MTRTAMLILCAAFAVQAQTPPPGSIQASGSATIHVTPDQAQLTVSVVTQGATAREAGDQNATITTAVIAALKGVVGNNGTVQTIAYYVSPRYTNSQPPAIAGYSATNTVQVTTNDISNIGRLIDTATQAGASSVGGLSFGLQEPDPAKQQALTKASQQALAHATAMATGLGRKPGAVISAMEGTTYAPVVAGDAGAAATATTPVQTGTVTVYANVTVTVALI